MNQMNWLIYPTKSLVGCIVPNSKSQQFEELTTVRVTLTITEYLTQPVQTISQIGQKQLA